MFFRRLYKFELNLKTDKSHMYNTSALFKELIDLSSKYDFKVCSYKVFAQYFVEIKLRCMPTVFDVVIKDLIDKFPLININSFKGV